MPKKWRNKWGALDDEAATRRDRKLLTLGNLAIITHSLNASIRDADWTTKKQGKGYKDGLALCAAGLATMAGALGERVLGRGRHRRARRMACGQGVGGLALGPTCVPSRRCLRCRSPHL